MKANVYSFSYRDKIINIKAFSKKQIGEYFKCSNNCLTNYCSKCSFLWLTYLKEKIDIDLTKGKENEL